MNVSTRSSSTKSRLSSSFIIPVPRFTGWLFFTTALFILFRGLWSSELALVLWASIILSLQGYLYLSLLWLSFNSKNAIKSMTCTITPTEAAGGESCRLSLSGKRIQLVPGIVDTIIINLRTFDGRTVEAHLYSSQNTSQFKVQKRGAYYAPFDFYHLMDVFGFFQLKFLLDAEKEARLLVIAEESDTLVETQANSGGNKPKTEMHFQRNNDLTESRLYAPGDDIRRINWKLLGHADELFVRIPEQMNPPKSHFAVLLDTSVDPNIFNQNNGPEAVDQVCALALTLINEITSTAECFFGYNGSSLLGGQESDRQVRRSAIELAHPAALSFGTAQDIPKLQNPLQSCIIFLLPRSTYENSALDRFIKYHSEFDIELVFVTPIHVDHNQIEQSISDNIIHYSRGRKLLARRV